jgi:hypothetical protein
MGVLSDRYAPVAPVAPAAPADNTPVSPLSQRFGAAPTDYDLGEVPQAALRNLPKSATQFAEGVAESVMHPVQTKENLLNLGYSLTGLPWVEKQIARGARGLGLISEEKKADIEKFTEQQTAPRDAFWKLLKDRYGSWENLKRTMAEDPVGFLGDASTVVSGGAGVLSKVPGLEKAATVSRAADVINPANLVTRLPLAAGSKAMDLAAGLSGSVTGAGGQALRDAATVSEGSIPFLRKPEQSEVFLGHLNGTRPASEIVDLGKSALDKMRLERGNAYRAEMAKAGLVDETIPSWKPIDQAVEDAKDVTMSRAPGQTTGPVMAAEAEAVRQQAAALVNEWKSKQDWLGTGEPGDPLRLYHQTAAGVDELKKAVNRIDAQTPEGRKVKADIVDAIEAEINTQAPTYSKIMGDYRNASDSIEQLEKTFSLGPNAMESTGIGKLQRSARPNAASNYKAMEEAFQKLAEYEPNLIAARAGQQLASANPRGLSSELLRKAGLGGGIVEAVHGGFTPTQLALGAAIMGGSELATSPRLAAGVARTMGQVRAPYRTVGELMRESGVDPAKATGYAGTILRNTSGVPVAPPLTTPATPNAPPGLSDRLLMNASGGLLGPVGP